MNWELPLFRIYCGEGGFRAEVPAPPDCYSQGETVEETVMNMKEVIEAHPLVLKEDGGEIPNEKSLLLEGWKSVCGFTKIVLDVHSKGLNDVGKVIKESKVLIMGLTYKENVSDTRESPVREMVRELKEFGIDIYGYDPLLSRDEIEDFDVCALDDLNVKVDCVIVTVAHNMFKKMKLEDLTRMMNDNPVLVDVRGMFDGKEAERKGFYYRSL